MISGFWPLNDNDNNIVVTGASGTQNATLSGGDFTSSKFADGPGGLFRYAHQYNGTDDFVDTNLTINSGTTITLVGWIYRPAVGTKQVFGTRGATSARFGVQFHSDGRPYFTANSSFPFSTSIASATGWMMFTSVYSGAATGRKQWGYWHTIDLNLDTGTQTPSTSLNGNMGPININREVDTYFGTSGSRYAGIAVFNHCFSHAEVSGYYNLAKPQIIVAPTFQGHTTIGTELRINDFWTDGTVTYQWYRNGSGIVGETSSTYSVPLTDSGVTLSCTITATNNIGSTNHTINIGTVVGAGSVFNSSGTTVGVQRIGRVTVSKGRSSHSDNAKTIPISESTVKYINRFDEVDYYRHNE